MKYQQRLAQIGDLLVQSLLGNIIEKGASDLERPTGKGHFHLAARADLLDMVLEQTGDVGRIAGCADRRHRACLRHLGGRGQHRSTSQTMADENCRRPSTTAQLICGCDEIGNVGGKRSISKLALARAQPGEIEAQHTNAERGQTLRNALGRVNVLAAGKAMGKQRVSARQPSRLVKERRELVSFATGEIKSLNRHC